MVNLADLLDAYNAKHKKNDHALSQLLGVTSQALRHWRSGKLKQLPSGETMEKFADLLTVPYGVVLEAALTTTGYIDNSSRRPAPSEARLVYLPTTGCDGTAGELNPLAVFSNEPAAIEWRDSYNSVSGNPEAEIAQIDLDPPPPRIFTTTVVRWNTWADEVETSTLRYSALPVSLTSSGVVVDLRAGYPRSGQPDAVYAVIAEGLNASKVLGVFEAMVSRVKTTAGMRLDPSTPQVTWGDAVGGLNREHAEFWDSQKFEVPWIESPASNAVPEHRLAKKNHLDHAIAVSGLFEGMYGSPLPWGPASAESAIPGGERKPVTTEEAGDGS